MKRRARRHAQRSALAGALVVAGALACNQRFDFDIPRAEGGASAGAPSGGVGGMAGRAGCSEDADCGLSLLHCNTTSRLCVECLSDAHCGASGRPRCDAAMHRCVECGLDLDCGGGQMCEPLSRSCVRRCVEDVDCLDDDAACDSERGLCFECNEDDECEQSESGPHCQPGAGRCAECDRDENCTFFCDQVTGACVECRTSVDCVGLGVCDPATYSCHAM